nr:ATP synthase protein 8 [Pristotis obtusirostris]
MPQLNPDPWLAIMLMGWVLILALLNDKVLTHPFQNDIAPTHMKKPELETWNWPWH